MPFTPTIKNRITLQQLKLEEDKPIYIRFESQIYKGKEVPNSDMEAPHLARVTNLETGELNEIVVGAVLLSVLTEDIDGEYEGKCFMVTMGKQEDGKRYRPYEIAEIEDPNNA